jgi:hypothetical protein
VHGLDFPAQLFNFANNLLGSFNTHFFDRVTSVIAEHKKRCHWSASFIDFAL